MASSGPSLRLFPSTSTQYPNVNITKPVRSATPPVRGELQGIAIQVSSASDAPTAVKPANEHIKHSLFCEPSSLKSTTGNKGSLRRHLGARRRSSGQSSITSVSPPVGSGDSPTAEEDEATPLPENTLFGSTTPPSKRRSGHLKRPAIPALISTEVVPDTENLKSPGGDQLSPLPSKTQFTTDSASKSEYPNLRSPCRSASPASSSRYQSPQSAAPPYSPGFPATSASLFPQYDHTKSLDQQQYYPAVRPQLSVIPIEKISKTGSPIDKKNTLERIDSAKALVDGYEHIPIGNSSDLQAVFNASCDKYPVAGRKMQLALVQPHGHGTSLAIGVSENHLLYSMDKDASPTAPADATPSKQLTIKKHHPEKPASSTVARLGLPDLAKSAKEREEDVVTVFPQLAAFKAIEAVASSAAASAIAEFDPRASSAEAARLAQDAVSEAHRRYRCELVRAARKRDSLGAVTATYKLQHPTLGSLPITVTKSTIGRHSCDPRAKISLHHPSATPAAVASETLVLAFLDFARDACVLDVPGLLALEGSFVIDTIICALLAIAVIENDALRAESITFEAPPKSALPTPKVKSRSTSPQSSPPNKSKRSSWWVKKDKKAKTVVEEEQVELPVLTEGALAILGLSFKTAVWVLEAGVKVTAGVLIGITHLAKKL